MIAFSTAWNCARHVGVAPAVREILAMGVREVAIDGPALAPDGAAAAKEIRAAKGALVALFAPTPGTDVGAGQDPAWILSPLEPNRRAALTAALAAGRAAEAAGTSMVVLRPGEIPVVDGSREQRWTERLARGEAAEVRAEASAVIDEMRRDRSRFLDMLCRSLWELARARPDLTWAVETPSHASGLPFPSECEAFLGELRGKKVGYWHDPAHAARLAALGVAGQEEWLPAARDRLAGITVADWSAASGSCPPGLGSASWHAIRAQLPRAPLRVLRLDPSMPAAFAADALRAAESLTS